mmetsp:Transcript_8543/g.53390  ORF Transcript_8543/g.53390 Transcript_8543/m.53390 type:complete len:87 (+) Transcript_8543:296-556(+)
MQIRPIRRVGLKSETEPMIQRQPEETNDGGENLTVQSTCKGTMRNFHYGRPDGIAPGEGCRTTMLDAMKRSTTTLRMGNINPNVVP